MLCVRVIYQSHILYFTCEWCMNFISQQFRELSACNIRAIDVEFHISCHAVWLFFFFLRAQKERSTVALFLAEFEEFVSRLECDFRFWRWRCADNWSRENGNTRRRTTDGWMDASEFPDRIVRMGGGGGGKAPLSLPTIQSVENRELRDSLSNAVVLIKNQKPTN